MLKATGKVNIAAEYDTSGVISSVSYEHVGGDLIMVSHELLQDAIPGLLICDAGTISFNNEAGQLVLRYRVIDRDDVCVLAQRCDNGKS